MDDVVKHWPIVLGIVGTIVWLIRLEGRVNGHDLLYKSMTESLAYIRGRMDVLSDRDHDRRGNHVD